MRLRSRTSFGRIVAEQGLSRHTTLSLMVCGYGTEFLERGPLLQPVTEAREVWMALPPRQFGEADGQIAEHGAGRDVG